MTSPTGRLVAFEGIDGCGKSTQARLLAEKLGARLTHEPGDTALGQALRRIVLGEAGNDDADHFQPVPRAEALLLAADKAQHVSEVVRPALDAGHWVVTDRFVASTLAYQGYGQGLSAAVLGPLLDWAVDGVIPDVTVLVDVPLPVARARLTTSPDRLERMDEEFFARVRSGYLELAKADPEHWAVIDGTGPAGTVAAAVEAAVRERVGDPPATAGARSVVRRP